MSAPLQEIPATKNTAGTTGTLQVIHLLHAQIDQLRDELGESKYTADDYKKRYASLSKRHDHIVEQLANAKHENDMINALLKRKERRILDLESSYNEAIASSASIDLKVKNLEIKCRTLQESEQALTAEYERLKIAYDTIVALQNEYRSHYTREVSKIRQQLNEFVADQETLVALKLKKLATATGDTEKLVDGLVGKGKTLELVYANKNASVIAGLKSLAEAAKSHGIETQAVVLELNEVLAEVYRHFPELHAKRQEIVDSARQEAELEAEQDNTTRLAAMKVRPSSIHSPLMSNIPRQRKSSSQSPKTDSSATQKQPSPVPQQQSTMDKASQRRRRSKRKSLRINSGDLLVVSGDGRAR